jgi:apolipoprotein N-acyltransferase
MMAGQKPQRAGQKPVAKPSAGTPVQGKSGRVRQALSSLRFLIPPMEQWKKARWAFVFAVISALLLRLAYQPFYLSPIAYVALVPLFWGLRRCRPVMAFWVAWVFASMMGGFGTSWFHVVSRFNPFIWLGLLPLAMYIGAYFAVALSVIVFFARRFSPWQALGAAMIVWAGMEFWFSIGPLGTPYGLAQSQGGWLSVAQIVSLGGMPLLSAVIIGFNLATMETILAFKSRYGHVGALMRLGTFVALILVSWIYGSVVIASTRNKMAGEEAKQVRLALLQPNIAQEDKYASYMSDDDDEKRRLQDNITKHQLDHIAEIGKGKFDLIVTPESTFTTEYIDVEESWQLKLNNGVLMKEVIALARDLETPIVIGATDYVFATEDGEETELLGDGIDEDSKFYPGHKVYGGLWIIRPDDEGIRYKADYRKRQLMPFGETVPYLGIIPGFQEKIVQVASFARGTPDNPLEIIARQEDDSEVVVKIGPSICFEDQFPYIQRHFAGQGANLFVNTTNDGWFDGSPGPAWHAEMARWRCIETRIPMVRCTNSGVTVAFSANGEYIQQLEARTQDTLKIKMSFLPEPGKTLYTRIGNVFGLLALLGSVGLYLVELRRFKREKK